MIFLWRMSLPLSYWLPICRPSGAALAIVGVLLPLLVSPLLVFFTNNWGFTFSPAVY
jgi:hypothetical protein